MSPSSLNFGTVAVGDSATGAVGLENTGSQNVEITALRIGGPDSTDFAIAGDPDIGVLAPEETRSVDIRFVPQTGGTKGAVFVVESSAGRREADLSGEATSTAPSAVTVGASNVSARQATLQGRVDPGGAQTTVVFEYFPTGQSSQVQSVTAAESPLTGSGEQDVTAPVDSLRPGTEYTVRVRAENSNGSDAGGTQTFTTQALVPEATVAAPADVRDTSATLVGRVNPGGAETTVTFEYFPSDQPDQVQTAVAEQSPLTGAEEQDVSASVTGLTPDTEYVFRVRAANTAGTGLSDNQTFTTGASPPSAVVEAPTNVTTTSAQLNGRVNPGGAETTVTFEYFPSGQPDQVQTAVAEQSPLTGTEEQDVSTTAGGLAPGTEYVFRVRAENSVGTDTSGDQIFATPIAAPDVVTEAPTNVRATSAQFNGRVNPGGAETTVTFEYFPSGQPDQGQTVTAAQSPLTGTEEQAVSATVGDLTPETDYTVRVQASNSAGGTTGGEQSFTTGVGVPIAMTQGATEVTGTSATLRGGVNPNGRETTVTFEYFPTAQSEDSQTVAAQQSPLTGAGEQEVSATIDGLEPRTQYTVRVRAENSAGSDTGDDVFFTTDVAPPEAMTEPPSNVAVTSVQFNGRVDPNNSETDVSFEYFPTDQPDQAQSISAVQSPLTGREAQDVSATADGLTPDTEYSVRVVATNEGGTSRGDPRTLTTASPELTVQRSAQVPERGSALDVQVTVSEGFQPTDTQLLYRQSGAQEYQSLSMSESGASTFVGTIPGTAITERGLEFYVRFSEGSITATAPETDPAAQPFFVPVRVSELSAPVQLQPEQYAMISVPLVLEDPRASAVLEDDFGALDRTEWRLLRWNSSRGEYDELTSENGETMNLDPGRPYWLISRDGGTFDVANAQSVRPGPVSITLPPGFTQIANPRAYPVAWSDVDGGEQVNAPIAFDPTAASEDPYTYNVSVLDPWGGYWVHNPGSTPIEITFPSNAVQGAASRPAASKTNDGTLLFETVPTYALRLKATLDRGERSASPSRLYDTHNVVGLAEGASPGVAREDVAEPPPVGDHVRLSIVEDETRLAGSLHPRGEEGHSWDLEVSARTSDAASAQQTVHVELREYGTAPSGFERVLIDRDTGRPISLDDGTFDLTLTDDRPTRRLRLILGTKDFVTTESRSVRPEQTVLRAVYPNPSPGPVSVDFQLEKAQRVHIAVFDMLGRRVHTLVDGRRPAGHHTARWDGTLDSGSPVASGMYLIRMKSKSVTMTRRIVLVR